VDALWLVVCIVSAVGLSYDDPRWMLIAPLAFGVYKLVAWAGFAVIGPDPDAPQRSATPPQRLALLRVFALGSRSERLFDAVTVHWRHVGSVELIAGPDLATTTIEPHELLDFVRGRLARRFITDPAALQQRMRELDRQPDQDWRYRVNDFFCTDDSWRAVLARIVTECDAVLMDLRGFNAERAGCVWEIKELLQTVSLGRIVLLVDATTDEQFLRTAIEQGWAALSADSPNVGMAAPVLRLFRVRSLGGDTVRALLGELSAATKRASPSTMSLGAGAAQAAALSG